MTLEIKRLGESAAATDIDDGVCMACNRPVTYDEVSKDDEACRRTKPYCTAPDDERVDWRASCLHATDCAMAAERERDEARRMLAATVVALDEALGLADTPEHAQDEQWYARRKSLGELCDRHERSCPPEALAAARSTS